MKPLLLALSFALLAACGSDASTICEKLDECNLLNAGVSVSDCEDEIEDAIDDDRADEDDVEDCADCLDDNSCSEITDGDCAVACDG